MSMLRPRKSTLGGFACILEFRRRYEEPLEVDFGALEINFGAVEDDQVWVAAGQGDGQ